MPFTATVWRRNRTCFLIKRGAHPNFAGKIIPALGCFVKDGFKNGIPAYPGSHCIYLLSSRVNSSPFSVTFTS